MNFAALALPAVEMVRQCAWCWLVMDASGDYRIRPGHKIASATHGICPGCKDQFRAEIDGRPAPGGRQLLVA